MPAPAMLGYCQELGVALEVEVNSSRSALMQTNKLNAGIPVPERRVVYDSRGHVSELLAKTELGLRSVTANGYAFGHLPSMQAKLDASRRSIEMLHPGHGKDLLKPIYISWGHIPWNLGSWISLDWNDDKALATLQAPDRRVYFAGDRTSRLVGWQEGAALSAYRVINQLGARIESGG